MDYTQKDLQKAVIDLPTGDGKTVTLAGIVKNKKAVFASNYTEIREQFFRKSSDLGVAIDVVKYKDLKPEEYEIVILCESLRGRVTLDHPFVIFM